MLNAFGLSHILKPLSHACATINATVGHNCEKSTSNELVSLHPYGSWTIVALLEMSEGVSLPEMQTSMLADQPLLERVRASKTP